MRTINLHLPAAFLLTLASLGTGCADDPSEGTGGGATEGGSETGDGEGTDGDASGGTDDPGGDTSSGDTDSDPTEGGEGCVVDGDCDSGERCEAGSCVPDGPPPTCGDGNLDPGEACDLGANNDDEGLCKTDCTELTCGDGFVGPGEACDDGNTVDTDSCTSSCELAACGDGFLQAPEACDDGNLLDTDACLNNCTEAACGDGIVWRDTEECDGEEGCLDDCRFIVSPTCGNGTLDPGEFCFEEVITESAMNGPEDVALGDLNGDGNLDVMANGTTTQVSIWLGNGNGTFGDRVSYTYRVDDYFGGPIGVAAGDMDGDGDADVVGLLGNESDGGISIRRGVDDATPVLDPLISRLSGVSPVDLFVGDAITDNAGDEVVVIGGSGEDSYFGILDFPGGTLTETTIDFTPTHVTLGEPLDRLGPIPVISSRESGIVAIMSDSGTLEVEVDNPNDVIVADLTGDGVDDVLVSQWDPQGCPLDSAPGSCVQGRVGLIRGDLVAMDVGLERTWLVGQAPQDILVADMNIDGVPDVVVANAISEDITILEGDTGPEFAYRRTLELGAVQGHVAMDIGDINNDGVPDIITVHRDLNSWKLMLSNP